MKKPTQELTPIAQLGLAFHFTSEDVRANRDGRLTLKQRRELLAQFWSTLFIGLLLLLGPSLAGLILVWWGTQNSLGDVLTNNASLAGYLTGAIALTFYVVMNYKLLLLPLDIMRGRVLILSGPVKRHGLYLQVRHAQLLMEAATLDLIQDGLQYTFYILPRSRKILSVEFSE
ncbi:MAG: hypothetical protein HY862_14210 [Chloroflexi bacterium]|nr:hypothetical protein [Chloroflexota bacterium]